MNDKLILLLILLMTGCAEIKENVIVYNDFFSASYIYESDPSYLLDPFMLSYYSPGTGTVNLNYAAPPYPPSLNGEAKNDTVIILNNVGRYIVSVDGNTGAENWRKFEPNDTPQSLFEFDENVLGYASGQSLVLIDKHTGRELSRNNIFGRYLKWIKKFSDKYLICFDENNSHTVIITDLNFSTIYSCPESVAYSRCADLSDNKLIIADTFNHRIIMVDITTNSILAQWNEYFPNAVEFIDQDNVYVLGEHSNRLYRINIPTGFSEMVFSATVEGFDDPYLSMEAITTLEHEGRMAANPQSELPFSKASKKYSGPRTLYSPNGFSVYKESVLISDTDNHRVIEVSKDGKKIIREINGLNNPVSAIRFEL